MKKISLIFLLFLLCAENYIRAQRTDQPWQLDIAAGLHSYYAPVEHLKWSRPELITTAAFINCLAQNNYSVQAYRLVMPGIITRATLYSFS
ncbi:MAG: hypothetical protein WDO19_30135 [Bacteroidota bacterium]